MSILLSGAPGLAPCPLGSVSRTSSAIPTENHSLPRQRELGTRHGAAHLSHTGIKDSGTWAFSPGLRPWACSCQHLLAGGPSQSHSLNHTTPRSGPAGPRCPNHTPLTPRALPRPTGLAPPSLHLPGSSAAWLRPRPDPRPPRSARLLRARPPAAARALPGPRRLRPHWACPGRAGRWEVCGLRAQPPRAEEAGPRGARTGHAWDARGSGKSAGAKPPGAKGAWPRQPWTRA